MTAYYSKLPDGRTVQRIDTLGLPYEALLGIEVHHPHLQAGDDRCAWTFDEVIAVEREIFGSSTYSVDEEGWFPEGHDTGILVEVFRDHDFPDLLRGRFVDPANGNEGSHGLHYDVTNLWTTIKEG